MTAFRKPLLILCLLCSVLSFALGGCGVAGGTNSEQDTSNIPFDSKDGKDPSLKP